MHSELIERLEKCTGPVPELDEAIQAWSVGATAEWQDYKSANAYHRDGFWVSIGVVQPYTASLDATIALVERLLPGWMWNASSTGAAWVMSFKEGEGDDFHTAKSEDRPAIALLIALLRALSSPEGTK